MKQISIILIGLVLLSCGSGGGSSAPAVGAAEIEGSIFNPGGPPPDMLRGIDASIVPTGDEIRLPDVRQGKPIEIAIDIINSGLIDLTDLRYEVLIEDAIFLTPEYWFCGKCYEKFNKTATRCGEVWVVFTEPLPICTGPPVDPNFDLTCDPVEYDCNNPYWQIEYNAAGDGYLRAEGSIASLKVNEEKNFSIQYGHNAIDVRDDHLGQWTVYDGKGQILDRKQYIFNVIP